MAFQIDYIKELQDTDYDIQGAMTILLSTLTSTGLNITTPNILKVKLLPQEELLFINPKGVLFVSWRDLLPSKYQ